MDEAVAQAVTAASGLTAAAWTAIGTIGLALVTVGAIVVSIVLAVQERKRNDKQRAADVKRAAEQLADEREHQAQVIGDQDLMAEARMMAQLDHSEAMLIQEREAASERLARQLEHSDSQLVAERAAAETRLIAQMAHSDEQLDKQRESEREALQLSEAYMVRVSIGAQDGKITDPYISTNPGEIVLSLLAIVVNMGRFTITDVAVSIIDGTGSMTDAAKVNRIPDYGLVDEKGGELVPLRDLGDRTLAPGSSGIRFASSARLDRYLVGAYPIVRWTDRWGQMWEHSKGRVRPTNSGTPMKAWP